MDKLIPLLNEFQVSGMVVDTIEHIIEEFVHNKDPVPTDRGDR
jgi:hypothetical protein